MPGNGSSHDRIREISQASSPPCNQYDVLLVHIRFGFLFAVGLAQHLDTPADVL